MHADKKMNAYWVALQESIAKRKEKVLVKDLESYSKTIIEFRKPKVIINNTKRPICKLD